MKSTVKCSTRVRPSVRDGREPDPVIRLYDGKKLLGQRSPFKMTWVTPFRAEARNVDIEVQVSGCPQRVEIELDGLYGEGPVTNLRSAFARSGDIVRLTRIVVEL